MHSQPVTTPGALGNDLRKKLKLKREVKVNRTKSFSEWYYVVAVHTEERKQS